MYFKTIWILVKVDFKIIVYLRPILLFWLSYIFCILWVDFFPPQCSIISQEEVKMQPCGPAFLQEPHAFPAAVWPASRVGSIFSVCIHLSCVLTCPAELMGPWASLGGFECWMNYWNTWLCDTLHMWMKEVSSLTLV